MTEQCGCSVAIDALRIRNRELGRELAELRERLARLETKVAGIQGVNHLWDGS